VSRWQIAVHHAPRRRAVAGIERPRPRPGARVWTFCQPCWSGCSSPWRGHAGPGAAVLAVRDLAV